MSASESAARAASDRGETRDDDREYLRALCPPGTTVYAITRHVSRSGMMRTIGLYVIGKNRRGEPELAWLPSPRIVAVLPWAKDDKKRDGNKIGGCGMDMHYHLVYELSRALWQADLDAGKIAPPTHGENNAGYLLEKRSL